MLLMSVSGVTKTYYEASVLQGASLELIKGNRIGLLGVNGSGKTTLMEMMAGGMTPDSGVISKSKGCKVGYLPQIPQSHPDLMVCDVVMQAFDGLRVIGDRMVELEKAMAQGAGADAFDEKNLEAYGRLQHQFEALNGYSVDQQVGRIRSALKIGDELWYKTYEYLSGGEKTRIALAAILAEAPDVMLLDEPTNHLDVEMIEWLEAHLNQYEGAVMVISHDRYFLDNVVDRIYEIDGGILEAYEGNYSMYALEKQKRYDLQVKHYENQQKKLKAMEAAIRRFREWGRIADNESMFVKAKQLERRIEKMEKIERPTDGKIRFGFDFTEESKSSQKVVVGQAMSKAYGTQVLLKAQDLEVSRRERVAIVGRNGSGKTTLFRVLMGEETLDGGSLRLGEGITPVCLEQEVQLGNTKKSILDYYKEEAMVEEGRARHILAGFGFKGAEVFRSVGSLSGGERSRLKLLILTGREANLLMLDEPTNHLDIVTKEKLEENITDFSGTVLFISHDRYFINMVATKVVELEAGTLTIFPGNYDDYKEKKMAMAPVALNTEPKAAPVKMEPPVKRNQKSTRNKYELERVELRISELETRMATVKTEMADKVSEYDALTLLMNEMETLEAELHDLMERWGVLQENS